MPRTLCSLERAVTQALGALEGAVPPHVGSLEAAVLWAMCSLEAAYKLELVSLRGAVPRQWVHNRLQWGHALHSMAGAVLREVGPLEAPVPWDLASLAAAVLPALCSLHAA